MPASGMSLCSREVIREFACRRNVRVAPALHHVCDTPEIQAGEAGGNPRTALAVYWFTIISSSCARSRVSAYSHTAASMRAIEPSPPA